MNPGQIAFTADAGTIVALLILLAFASLFVAAAYKFITKKKGGVKYGRPGQEEQEREETQEPEARGPEAKDEPAPAVEEEEYAEGFYGDREGEEAAEEPPKPGTKPVEVPKPAEKGVPPPKADEAPKPVGKVEEPPKEPPRKPKEPAKPKTLKEGLGKTRGGFIAKINSILFGGKKNAEAVLEEIEEALFTADIGVKTSQRLLEFVRKELSGKELQDPARVRDALKAEIASIVNLNPPPFAFDKLKPFVIMMIGVNGVGKTTTIGKIGQRLSDQGLTVIMAAGDTFRAAAAEQIEIWGERTGIQVIRGQDGGDPASVVYDAISAAKSKGADVVIADTAGRLHTKQPLMEEIKKVKRVMAKAHDGAPHEVLLVVDANTGQNAIAQAREFNEALGVTGIILTKLDGTAKGGVIIGICDELKIPVRFIGIGETVEDLRVFDPREFTEALFEEG